MPSAIAHRLNTFLLILLVLMVGSIVAFLATRAGAGPLDPPRAPGSTQTSLIFEPASCAGFPIVISSPGSYALAENITMPGGCAKDGIDISSSGVTLDLRGFTVQGIAGALTGIKVPDPSPSPWWTRLTVENGKIAGWPAGGLDTRPMTDSQIRKIEVTQNGPAEANGAQIELGWANTLTDCVASDSVFSPGAIGIIATGFDVVERCLVFENGAQGIKANGYSRIANNHLTDNDSNAAAGCADLWTTSGNNIVEDNTVEAYLNDTCPIYIDGVKDIVHRNVARNGTPNYTIPCGGVPASCDIGPIGTSAASTSPWANISD